MVEEFGGVEACTKHYNMDLADLEEEEDSEGGGIDIIDDITDKDVNFKEQRIESDPVQVKVRTMCFTSKVSDRCTRLHDAVDPLSAESGR